MRSLSCLAVFFKTGTIKQLKPAGASPLTDALGGQVADIQRVITSLMVAQGNIIIFGVALPIVMGFTWLLLLRFFAGIFTYIMIIAIGAVMYARLTISPPDLPHLTYLTSYVLTCHLRRHVRA